MENLSVGAILQGILCFSAVGALFLAGLGLLSLWSNGTTDEQEADGAKFGAELEKAKRKREARGTGKVHRPAEWPSAPLENLPQARLNLQRIQEKERAEIAELTRIELLPGTALVLSGQQGSEKTNLARAIAKRSGRFSEVDGRNIDKIWTGDFAPATLIVDGEPTARTLELALEWMAKENKASIIFTCQDAFVFRLLPPGQFARQGFFKVRILELVEPRVEPGTITFTNVRDQAGPI